MMQFNHVANRLDARHFETVVEMLKAKLGFVELRRTERAIWLRQPGANVDLQFSRSQSVSRELGQDPFAGVFPEHDAARRSRGSRGVGAGSRNSRLKSEAIPTRSSTSTRRRPSSIS